MGKILLGSQEHVACHAEAMSCMRLEAQTAKGGAISRLESIDPKYVSSAAHAAGISQAMSMSHVRACR